LNRKQRRKAQKEARRLRNKDLEEKLSLVSSLEDMCRACHEPFDKTNIEMISEWMIVVREENKETHLYCPECWNKAMKIVQEASSEN
tara:strand:- start:377 stop:637 length:261 start_codon:yes stop_codon:yes gene_type:complete